MARLINRLDAKQVRTLTEPGRYPDGGGLYLQISEWQTKAWLFRYQLAGRPRHMGLGPIHTVDLAAAREMARTARGQLLDGIDPLEAKNAVVMAARAADAKRVTFGECAAKYIEAHRASWKNPKHADQWQATLSTYAYPIIERLPVDAIETAHIIKIVEPIWSTKTETASRVRGRIETVLDWASAQRFRSGDNPARWRGHLDKLLPAKSKVSKVEHQPALPYAALPAFMADLKARPSISARALEFTILTAARTSETTGAQWSEFDMAAKVWTCPGVRTKSGRDHRVPLGARVIKLLSEMPRERENKFVFPGARAQHSLSNMAMLELLQGTEGCAGLTVHGFRSTFRDWAGDTTDTPREVIETALAHVVADKTEAAYRRGDALEKRRHLMAAWNTFCTTPVSAVTPIRAAA